MYQTGPKFLSFYFNTHVKFFITSPFFKLSKFYFKIEGKGIHGVINIDLQNNKLEIFMIKYPFGYCVCIQCFTFFFRRPLIEFQWLPCTVYRTHKPLFSTKFSLKISLTTLFIHLKIILLQCFQFSTN